MYSFFFAIVFIAEVIITANIVSFIIKCDRKICEINDNIYGIKSEIPNTFKPIHKNLNTVIISIENIKEKLNQKKNKYKYSIIKNIVTGILFIALNTKGKKIITCIELLFSIRDFIDTTLKSFNSLKK